MSDCDLTAEYVMCNDDVDGFNDNNIIINIISAVKSNRFQYFVTSTSNWPKSYSVTK